VPDDARIDLQVQALAGSEPVGGGWSLLPSQQVVDLGFLSQLPPNAVQSMSVHSADEATFDAVAHLAPGLHRLYLGWSGFGDAVLPTVAMLTELVYLQTFGNNFTDTGVQVLSTLKKLEYLYLEEETLSFAAFDFVRHLPALSRLGLQDVPLRSHELEELRGRLPGVAVG
jgi:hypothetical protein